MHYQAISNKFIYASENVKAAYLEAYAQAEAVLTIQASQTEVKEAIANLKVARETYGRKPRVVKPRNQDKHKYFKLFLELELLRFILLRISFMIVYKCFTIVRFLAIIF